MKATPRPLLTRSSRRFRRQSLISAAACLLAHASPAAVITWSGDGGDDNWSTSANWSGGLPADNEVVFADADANGTAGPAGPANNVVDVNTTIASLRYTNIQPGNHTTGIPAGVALTVNGGGTSIEVQSPTTDPTAVVHATILGEGTLAVNNTAATLYVGQGAASADTARRATLDMSGLETFSATLSQVVIGRQINTTSPNRPQGTLRLAHTNTLDLSGNPGILLGSIVQNNGNTANAQVLELGLANTIRSDSGMTIGGRKGNGYVRFNSESVGLGEGSAVFRNLAGTDRQANWLIGDNSGQSGGGTTAAGEVDFSLYGEVDALVGNIIVGRSTAGSVTNSTAVSAGTLAFDSGVIDVNDLSLGIHTTSARPGNVRGTVNVDGTGKLLVNNSATFGRYVAGDLKAEGILNIGTSEDGGGEVEIRGNVLCGTGTGNKITVHNSGVLRLGGVLGTTASIADVNYDILETLDLADSTLYFNFGPADNPAEPRANVGNLIADGTVDIVVTGSNLSPGTIKLIDYQGIAGSGFTAFNLLPTPGLEANLVNNTSDGSIDLVITAITGVKWTGTPDGSWDINVSSNWQLVPGGTPTTYQESAGTGPRALFDDTATGTRTVNLTTAVSPLEVAVDTAQTYTFNGSGALGGAGGLLKQGSGTLVLGNSGVNDFAGNVRIDGGTLRLAGTDDRLPTAANVTLADSPGAQLDLNGTNQTLAALSGAGVVRVGTGTLTLSGAGTYSGVLQGSGSLVKSGAGNHVLSGANTFAGGTTITGGRIILTNADGSGLGSGPVVIGASGSLAIGDGNDTGSIDAAAIANDGLIVFNRSDETTLDIGITGAGGITKTGEGSLAIESAQSYGGLTTVNGGGLRVSDSDALGAATGLLADGTIINNAPGARLELGGGITLAEPIRLAQKQGVAGDAPCLINMDGDNTLTGPLELTAGGSFWNIWSEDGKLTIAGPVSNITTSNTRLIRFYGESDGEILSDLADGAAPTALTALQMNGTGTWILAGNNTYSGPTTVNFGTLVIDGSHTASAVTVNFGATLGGSGTLGTVTANGVIAPGGGIGTLGAAEVTLTGLLAIEVAGSSADRLTVSGTLDLTDATISVTGTPTAGSYILASAGTLIGTPVLDSPVPGYEMVIENNRVKLNSLGGLSPYETWAGGEAFGNDANGDGVSNGLAFLLGAANPNANALGLLPTPAQSGGGLVLTFKMRNAANRGGATLSLQHSSDLGITDLWTSVAVPETSGGPLSGITFTVTPGDPLNNVVATIHSSQAAGGHLFGRLQGQNP